MSRRQHDVRHTFVDVLPTPLLPGVVYISGEHDTAAHLCCCGCGHEVVTPLGQTAWTLRYNGRVSLSPSIGNGALPCRSHYVIRDSEVLWLSAMTPESHDLAHARDHAAVRITHPNGWERFMRVLASTFGRWRR